ncbi:myeloid-derived growth factor-like [Saccoglossus kowalevskii]|uniref:UPF0556 protein C19orf10-like n=1 Tax=Saccoglossus kowalevskii TaxID=10224 RepID=A0ABM0M7A6_SACKO|nr:PREDICTED: UPF0556 protein C19orf10-like [Saccoglossus kowalevskii]
MALSIGSLVPVVLIVLFTVLGFLAGTAHLNNEHGVLEEVFDVKPGGETITVEHSMGSFSCAFTYVSHGGTNEGWVMTISANPEKTSFTCTVERPGGRSYLFFQLFNLKIKGAKIEEAEAFGDADEPLRAEEYVVNKKKNAVSYKEGMFRSHLTKIMVLALGPKTEL